MKASALARELKAKRSGAGWIAKCPAHDDRTASLKIDQGEDGRLLLYCHAGCTFDQIVKAAGIEPTKPDNGPERRPKSRTVAIYDYRDARGELVFQVVRKHPKSFPQRRPDGKGDWIWDRGDTPDLPYRLPELLDANEVFVVEGEKDADNLAKLGLVATTNPKGADTEWPDGFGRYFDGRHVILIPDNDEPGHRHVQNVARKLSGKAASIRVLELPDLPPKGDVSDWLAAGGTKDRLLELATDAPEWEGLPNGEAETSIRQFYWTLDDIALLDPPEWLVETLLARRAKALLFGESGDYKTIHAVDLLCHIAHGMDYHGLAIPKSYPVCFIVNEDRYNFAVQRLQGWHRYYGKPSGRVIVIRCDAKLDNPEDVQKILAACRDAFGDERPIFAVDTWDRSINGNPNSTEDVNPALNGLDTLLASGEATLTISHSPWSDTTRTKGAVTFWANHETRLKAEKDKVTGRGTLIVIHHKNARGGLELAFDFEVFAFDHGTTTTDTLIPRRDFDHQPKAEVKRKLGDNEKIVRDALVKAVAEQTDQSPPANGIPQNAKGCSVERWQATAMLVLPQPEVKRRGEAFGRALTSLVAANHVRHLAGYAWLP